MQIVITTFHHQYWKYGLHQGLILDVYEGVGADYPRQDGALWVRCPNREFGFALIPPNEYEVFVEE